MSTATSPIARLSTEISPLWWTPSLGEYRPKFYLFEVILKFSHQSFFTARKQTNKQINRQTYRPIALSCYFVGDN